MATYSSKNFKCCRISWRVSAVGHDLRIKSCLKIELADEEQIVSAHTTQFERHTHQQSDRGSLSPSLDEKNEGNERNEENEQMDCSSKLGGSTRERLTNNRQTSTHNVG